MPHKPTRDKKTTRERISDILHSLSDGWALVSECFPSYSDPRNLRACQIKYSNAEIAYRRHWEEYQRLQYLKRKKWIAIKETERGLLMALTNEGKKERLRRTALDRPKLPGHQCCLVTFDIPEAAQTGRKRFRLFLKRLGFTMTQLSVWQTDRDVVNDVLRFIRDTGISKWTEVYLAQRLKIMS